MVTVNQLIHKSQRIIKKIKARSNTLDNCPQRKGVCFKVTTMKPKKPNSAIRKIAKVRLTNGRKVIAYIPGQGHSLQEHSVVLVKGGRTPDLPGVRYRLIKGKLDFAWKESFSRKNARSKYGVPKNKV